MATCIISFKLLHKFQQCARKFEDSGRVHQAERAVLAVVVELIVLQKWNCHKSRITENKQA